MCFSILRKGLWYNIENIITDIGDPFENMCRREIDMQHILVLEDDYDLNQAICYSLKKQDMEFMVRPSWKKENRFLWKSR